MISSLGPAIVQQLGLVIMLVLVLREWVDGRALEMDKIVAMLATVYLLFNSTNFFMFFGVNALVQFLAIIDRLAIIFEMEENKVGRLTDLPAAEVKIEAIDADFSWGFKV